jgi:hypothetical protein
MRSPLQIQARIVKVFWVEDFLAKNPSCVKQIAENIWTSTQWSDRKCQLVDAVDLQKQDDCK